MKKLIFLLTLTFSSYALLAQDNELPSFLTNSLDNYIKKGMKDWRIPGLSVAIIKNGEVVFIQGYGVTKIGGKEPVDENTIFMIGSNTKAFTATILAILQEAGKISLDDKVKKWMPEFMLRDSLAGKAINIADLLSHRIGFETFQGDFTFWTSTLSRAEVIQKMALIHAPYDFRTKFGYCNAAFVTAGELIPRITGKNWEEMVRDSILILLKMNRTLMLTEELKKTPNFASPHTLINNELKEIPIPDIDNLAPAGSMSSSAKDMVNWLLTQLENGKFEGSQVISTKAIQAIRRPYSIVRIDTSDNKQTHFYLYELGLVINDRNEKLVYSHIGGTDGFLSSVRFIPEEKIGIIVLTNTDQNNFYQDLTNEIQDAFLGLPYQDYSDKSLTSFKADKKNSSAKIDSLKNIVTSNYRPSLPLESYTGKYINEVYGDISIKLDKKSLNIYFSNHPNLIGKLEHIQNDSYLCTYSNPTMGVVEIPFKIDNGKIAGLTLHVADFVEFTPYEFIKVD